MISGEIEVPIVPQIGDVMTFDLQRADVIRHEAAAKMGLIEVTNRLVPARADGIISVMLSDITVKTKEDALQVMAFFEDCFGLFGDRWDEQDTKAEAKE
jgi:hypothetical protein